MRTLILETKFGWKGWALDSSKYGILCNWRVNRFRRKLVQPGRSATILECCGHVWIPPHVENKFIKDIAFNLAPAWFPCSEFLRYRTIDLPSAQKKVCCFPGKFQGRWKIHLVPASERAASGESCLNKLGSFGSVTARDDRMNWWGIPCTCSHPHPRTASFCTIKSDSHALKASKKVEEAALSHLQHHCFSLLEYFLQG